MLQLLGLLVLALVCVQGRQITPAQMRARQRVAAEALLATRQPSSGNGSGPNVKNITFSNPKASRTSASQLIFVFNFEVSNRVLC